jgi:hypothetical protein
MLKGVLLLHRTSSAVWHPLLHPPRLHVQLLWLSPSNHSPHCLHYLLDTFHFTTVHILQTTHCSTSHTISIQMQMPSLWSKRSGICTSSSCGCHPPIIRLAAFIIYWICSILLLCIYYKSPTTQRAIRYRSEFRRRACGARDLGQK